MDIKICQKNKNKKKLDIKIGYHTILVQLEESSWPLIRMGVNCEGICTQGQRVQWHLGVLNVANILLFLFIDRYVTIMRVNFIHHERNG
jgi:hypothetical protein